MEQFTLIKSDNQIVEFRKYLHREEIREISMDFEGEYNLHCYGEKLCLIQIYDGKKFFIIDPFTISGGEIKKFLEMDTIKYMYGAESDISLVYKQYGAKLENVYDQKLLVDTLDLPGKGLSSVLEHILGIKIQGKKNFQMYNWTIRPVRAEALDYALQDVKYLFNLNTSLMDLIQEKDICNELIHRIIRNHFDYDKKRVPGIFKQKDYILLSQEKKEVFKRIFDAREKLAEKNNVPPSIIISKEDLFLLTENREHIRKIGFNRRVSEKMKQEIVETILKA